MISRDTVIGYSISPLDGVFESSTWYQRHVYDILVRVGTTFAVWFLALFAYFGSLIGFDAFLGVSCTDTFIIVAGLATTPLFRKIRSALLYTVCSVADHILLVLAYTSLIYWLGGIEATYMTPIYVGFIMYVGIIGTVKWPLLYASVAAWSFVLIICLEHYGALPSRIVVERMVIPWPHQIGMMAVVVFLLYLIGFISKIIRNLLIANHEAMIRQRMELEEAKVEAQRSDRLKTAFMANMSHELRTPLTHIIGFTELLLDDQAGTLDEQQRELQKAVLGSGRHLLTLIDDLLNISKIEAGEIRLNKSEIALDRLLQKCGDAASIEMEAKSLSLTIHVEEMPRPISIDVKRIEEVILALLSNLASSAEPGGVLELSVSATTDGGRNRAQVSLSTGDAMGENTQVEFDFNPFNSPDDIWKHRPSGTGLGLAISKRLIELHGGEIFAYESAEGRPAGYRFTIPIDA